MSYYNEKNILIWGYGREGKSSLKYFYDRGCKVSVTDSKNFDIPQYIPWQNVKDRLDCFDLVVKSPGVPIGDIDISNINLTSQTDIFLQEYSSQTVGITGTKGKSTTTSLIHHVLNGYNNKAHIAGNIGIPPLDVAPNILPDETVVLELSCHQLEYLKAPAPHITIFLNVFEEHLDRYGTLDGYVSAKGNILVNQRAGDIAIVGENSLDYVKHLLQDGVRLITVGGKGYDIEITDSGAICCGEHLPLNIAETKLIGKHNLYNIAIAYTVCVQLLGVPSDKFIELVRTFAPLPHRLQYVGCFGGVHYYDDSISTAVDTAISAMDTLKSVDTIIIGGMDRGIDYTRLAKYLLDSNVKNILLIGQTTDRIFNLININNTDKNIEKAYNMDTAVKLAVNTTTQGGTVLLSPAAASYDCYENFEKRGEHFCKLIKSIALAP